MLNNLKKKIKILKRFDIFGCPINLKMKNENTYKTMFGGFLTVVINIFFMGVIIFSFYKLFSKQNLETFKYQMNLGATYGHLDLNEKNFMIAVKFDYNTLNNWTNPYMNVTATQITRYRNSTLTWEVLNAIKMRPCLISDFIGLERDFHNLGLSSALCPSENSNMTVQGNFQEDFFANVNIKITTCSNKSICQTNETITKEISSLDNLKFQMFITNNIIDETNFEEPISRQVVVDTYFLIDPIKTVYRTADIFLNEIEISTDKGYTPSLFSEILPNKTYSYNNEFREQTVFTNQDANSKINIADFYFRKSQIKYKYERYLGNLLTILSYLGGIWSTCYIFFLFIANQYSHYCFVNTLSNQLYSYPSQIKKKNTHKKKVKNNNSPVPSPILLKNSEEITIYKKIMDKIETYLSYDRKLKFTFCDMWIMIFQNILSFLKFRNEKYILMKKSEDNLNRDLDICNILKKIHEFDKIKSLLFTDEQLIMLGFSPKPDIFSSDIDPRFFEITSMKTLSKSLRLSKQKNKKTLLSREVSYDDVKPFKQLILAWKALKNAKTNEANINQNLMRMFGEEFSKIVDLKEEEMQIFSAKNIETGNKFLDLRKDLQNVQTDPKNKRNVKFQKDLSLHSENFINCAEKSEEKMVSIVGGKIEKLKTIYLHDGTENPMNNRLKKKLTMKGEVGLRFEITNNESIEAGDRNIELFGIFKKDTIDFNTDERRDLKEIDFSEKRNLTQQGLLLSQNDEPINKNLNVKFKKIKDDTIQELEYDIKEENPRIKN